jgi:NAD(P)-dependent dehydrogenase (short-subunit alcohol dehydrogenase family)
VRAAIEEWGRLDIAVNNAGILRDGMSFKLSETDWDDVIRVHLRGHAAVARAVGRHWRERSKAGDTVNGRLVNTTSEAGLYGLAGQLNYVAAKAGIAAMTVALAEELHRYGVTVNAVAPRARTRMTEPVLGASVAPPKSGFDEWDPANIAPVVAWLASDAAADVNGEVFVVFASQVHRMTGWSLATSIETDGRWTVDALTARTDELLGSADLRASTS